MPATALAVRIKIIEQPIMAMGGRFTDCSGAKERMAKEAQGKQNEVLIFKGSAHAQEIFRTSNGPRLTNAILERLIKRAQLQK